jgi:hypothetical protein
MKDKLTPLEELFMARCEEIDFLRTQLADATRKLEEARKDAERITTLEDAILIGMAMLNEIISADQAALTELSNMSLQVPEPVLTAKARHTVAQMLKAIEQGKGVDDV